MTTPEQKRDAWIDLHRDLTQRLLGIRETEQRRARAAREGARTARERVEKIVQRRDATAWAAQRLLEALAALPAPVVPVDDAKGQATIYDALEQDRPHRLIDYEGDRWEQVASDLWAYIPNAFAPRREDTPYDMDGELWGPAHTLADLKRLWDPREPVGDEYYFGARSDEGDG